MGADVPELFLGPSRLGRADLNCSLRMILVMECARKEKKGLQLFFLKNLVNLLKSLVATAYVDCTGCVPCKQLCEEHRTFARKATYCVHIRLVRSRRLVRTMYVVCALSRFTRTRRTLYAQVASSAQVIYVRNKSLTRKKSYYTYAIS